MLAAFLLAAPLVALANAGTVEVTATVSGLRSAKGTLRACLTARPDAFPDCDKDPAARAISLAAATQDMELDFGPVPAGRYAIAVFHDENDNGRLDRRLMVPREGYGFSRDAPVRFGPPSFAKAAFAVAAGAQHQDIRMRYIL